MEQLKQKNLSKGQKKRLLRKLQGNQEKLFKDYLKNSGKKNFLSFDEVEKAFNEISLKKKPQ